MLLITILQRLKFTTAWALWASLRVAATLMESIRGWNWDLIESTSGLDIGENICFDHYHLLDYQKAQLVFMDAPSVGCR
jgi:hypothetical protein